MQNLFLAIRSNLDDLTCLLGHMNDQQYNKPHKTLGNATIGGHYRHIIELFSCLIDHYGAGHVNYDSRERNKIIETDIAAATERIEYLKKNLEKRNKTIVVEQNVNGSIFTTESNYYRELLYNLEHSIHHQALIKIGVAAYEDIVGNPDFGIAPSTIAYREQCVR